MQDTEKFYPIKGFEGYYEITKSGRVRSVDRFVPGRGRVGKCFIYGKEIKPHVTNKGYFRIQLCKPNHRRRYSIHRLLAINFIENPNNLPVINHKNGIRTDNSLSNLEWCDFSKNNKDRFERNNFHCGRKLSKKDVTYIRSTAIQGRNGNINELAEKFKCTTNVINKCLSRKTYLNIENMIDANSVI